MRKFLILLLSFFCLSVSFGYSQDPPDSHPARQMRQYYADVYTGSTILEYKAESLDSILFVVSQFIEPAQVISVYSYKQDPYNFRRKQIYDLSSKNLRLDKNPLEKVTYGYSGVSGFYLRAPEGAPEFVTFTRYNPR